MNKLVGLIICISFGSSLGGTLKETAEKRSILESFVPGFNIPVSGIDFNSGIAVPHTMAVPVPHPILVPIDRPVPVPVDRPVPYPVHIIKRYFIPVPFNAMMTKPFSAPSSSTSENKRDSDFGGKSEMSAESKRIYRNEVVHSASTITSKNNNSTVKIEISSLPKNKTAELKNSLRIHVSDT